MLECYTLKETEFHIPTSLTGKAIIFVPNLGTSIILGLDCYKQFNLVTIVHTYTKKVTVLEGRDKGSTPAYNILVVV